MKIGILGGSFNPPHLGHILVAQQVLEFTDIEHIWFLPCFTHTFEKPLAAISDRLAMTKLLAVPNTSVSTLEIDHKLDGNTINLLPLLKSQFPHDEFTFIIGSDQLNTFTKWGNWEQLIAQLSFLVVPRAEHETKPLLPGMVLLSNELLVTTSISSTVVRRRIARNVPINHLVPEPIVRYITDKKLYAAI